jgi:ABC-type branched-subunit amino acid transport system substrate-binding protein
MDTKTSSPIALQSRRKLATPGLAAVSLAALLAACATAPSGPTGGPITRPADTGQAPVAPPDTPRTRAGLTPPFMEGRDIVRVGLLLPFSTRPEDAQALYNAAELALFDHADRDLLLIPRDSGGSEADAVAAARGLLSDGVDVIVGPVLREGVAGAGQAARRENVPVIGLSSDRTVAGPGVYLLSFQLEDEVARIVAYAVQNDLRRIGLMAPNNEYGRRVAQALREEAGRRGASVVVEQLYTRGVTEVTAAAGTFATQARGANVQAVLIADNGSVLRAAASGLNRAGIRQPGVRFLGTSAWAGTDLSSDPLLSGAWFVASDPALRQDFEQRYQAAYRSEPSRLASLSYDAVALAALLTRDAGPNGLQPGDIQRQDGFLGADGVFRFNANGTIERGWAVMEVRQGGEPVAVAPAPRRFTTPAS